MMLRRRSLELASRLSRAGLLAFYAAIALLGSGGLHALAPGCHSGCCATQPAATHTHKGCTHHHHGHCHSAKPLDQKRDDAPKRCPEGCLICEFAATPAVPVALVVILPQQQLVDTVTPPHELDHPCVLATPFWIRGPPSLG
jgi:hypothetical protein